MPDGTASARGSDLARTWEIAKGTAKLSYRPRSVRAFDALFELFKVESASDCVRAESVDYGLALGIGCVLSRWSSVCDGFDPT